MQPRTGPQILIKEILLSHLRESYRDLLKAAQDSDLLITHPLTFAGPLVAEKTRIPWISTVLSPISFFSAYDLPVFPPYPYLKKLDFLAPWTGKLLLRFVRLMTRHLSGPVRQMEKRQCPTVNKITKEGATPNQKPQLIKGVTPHHIISGAGLVGGGHMPKPGEFSLVHNGIPFL